MIKVGIIGCGRIAQRRHIPEYQENPNTQIVGYYDWNYDRAAALAAQFGGTAYHSIDEMLAVPEIDAISVCSTNQTHAENTIKALQAGKHVLCEKPMAITLEECEAMVDAARAAGKVLAIGQNQRLTPPHVIARNLIQEGRIGRVLSFRTTFAHGGPEQWSIDQSNATWFFDRKQAAFGALADLGIHKTDLIQYLTGERIVRTTARLATIDKKGPDGNLIGVDDNAICIYELSNGAIGTMTASWTNYGWEDNSTLIFGDKGVLRILEDPQITVRLVQRDGMEVDYKADRIQTNDFQSNTGVINAFEHSITTGSASVLSGESVLSAMRVIFASLESSERGCPVDVPMS